MDSFTQDMLERAKQRRELLAQKMGDLSPRRKKVDLELSPCRKRSSPLHESTNTKNSESLDDSFQKRQRLLAKDEQSDIAPISTSRLVGLAALKKTKTDRAMETDEAPSMSRTAERQMHTESGIHTPSRKSRLAALACNINSWEDDLSRVQLKKEAPKKVWQPPKAVSDDSPAKPPRAFENSPIKNRTASPFKSPVRNEPKVARSSPAASPRKNESPKTHSSSLTIQLAATKGQEKDLTFVPGQTTRASPAVKKTSSPSGKLAFISGRTSELTPSNFVGKGATKGSPVSKASVEVEKAVSSRISKWQQKAGSRTPQKDDEPTEKPVAGRLALWQKKVDAAESETQKGNAVDLKPGFNKTPSKAKSANTRTAIDEVFDKVNTPKPVGAARSAPVKAATKSPTKSPSKQVCPSTKNIHDRLTSLQDGWKKNEISEKITQQRQQELAQLQKRWTAPEASVSSHAPVENSATPGPIAKPQEGKTPKGQKREMARDKIRNDFENKLQAMGFELNAAGGPVENVASFDLTPIKQREKMEKAKLAQSQKHTKSASPLPQTSSSGRSGPVTPAATPGRSLFGLIKGTPASSGPSSTSSSAPAATPVMSMTKSRQCDDSFEDSFEDEAFQETGSSRKSVHFERPESSQSEYTDTASTCSEEQQGASTQDDHSEGEEIYESQEYTTEYSETEYSEEDDEEEVGYDGQGNISELLDEAMDTTETEEEAPLPAPRKKRSSNQLQDYRHDNHTKFTTSTHVSVKSPSKSKVEVRATMSAKMQDVTSSSSCRSSSGTESDDKEVVYSIDMYRSSKNARQSTPNSKMIIVRHPENALQREVKEEKLPIIPEQDVKKKLQEFQELVNQEQTIIMQTSKALNNCCSSGSAFHGSAEAVECHRVLLMACKKREAYLGEMQKMREKPVPQKAGPKGSLTISDIRLPLKSDVSSRLNTAHSRTVHYFIVMIRSGARVIFTQMVSTRDALVRGCLDIPNLIKFNDITDDFVIELQVYGMSITQEEMTPKKKRGLTPKKKNLKSALSHLQSPAGPFSVHTTNFTHMASLQMTKRSLDKSHFSLERIPFSSPLNGTINLRMRCLMEVRINRHGFLTMFEDVSGFGAWHRRWFALVGHTLSFWKYPDDEKYKEPMDVVDLKCCITDRVDIIPRDICARPNSFELLTVRRQHRGEADTLVQKVYNTMTTRKNWLAADTKDERISWCHTLNEALANIRMWHPDALRPIKRHSPESAM